MVTVCRLDRPRDFPTLLAAFADVARRVASTSLWIVGDGPLRDDIARQVRAAGLDERVRLLGMVRDVPGVLAASDVFVLTSTGGDGLPIGILEAMVAGLPVVATRCDGIPEAVGEGQTGLLVPRADSAALSRALDELVAGAERRRALGAEGRRVALRSFAIEDCVAALAALYEQIVARGGRDE